MYHVSLGLLQKKPFLHPHLLQLLLAVGLLRWTAPPEPWSPRYMSNDLSGFRGSLDALQLAPWETYAPRVVSLIHPKAIQQSDAYFDLETFCDYDRLARAASRGPLIAYLAEDGAPSRTPHASTGSTALEECQTESLSREDADLIEILWKQDVDLGIPLEDYRPCNAPTSQSLAAASPPPKSVEGSTIVPVDKLESKKDFEPSTNEPRVTSIDSETGEPIFEPVAGPSTIDGVLNSNSSSDSFLDINALMGVVNEELFCADPEWAHMPGYSGASSPPFNGTDPFGGVLLQNVSMPSSLDASITAANMTMQQPSPAAMSCFASTPTTAASTMGEAPGSVAGCSELTKPTVTDQHAIRDLFTYNTSTQGSWDSFELFYEDLTAIASNNTTANNSHSESNRVVPLGHPSVSQPTQDRVNATPSNGASVSLKHTTIGDGGYAASDTGVSSMYSDEANEEWMESSSETSHDHDQEQLVSTDISYHSNSSSMSFGSSEGCAVPQKKYNFFGRKPYQQQGQTSNGTMELSEESHVVPQPIKIAHDPAMDGFLHNHSYGQEQLSSGYSVPQLPIGVKLEQLRPDPKKQRALSQADGYDSSDPSESGAAYIQVTSAKDERRARELKIPIPTEEIVTLSIDEFNERLARYELTEDQHVLIRDIRRRGKNKVAAQNCRKRKLDQISALQGEVENFQDTCRSLQNENNELTRREAFAQQRLSQLRDVIANAANSGAIPKHHGHHDRMANSE